VVTEVGFWERMDVWVIYFEQDSSQSLIPDRQLETTGPCEPNPKTTQK
jgi:hypothetical protein